MTQPATAATPTRTSTTKTLTSSWRQKYPVHPCADVFPMMDDQEIDALAEDIRVNGLKTRITLWSEGMGAGHPVVLDGRNRLEALSRLGVDFTSGRDAVFPDGHGEAIFDNRYIETAPAPFVISMNIRRRHLHLTKQQQAELIIKTIEAGHLENDRATVARSFSPTAGTKGGSTKDPILAAAVTEGAKIGIGKRTIQTARAKVQGKAPAPRRKIGVSSTPPTSEAVALGTPRSSPSNTTSRQSDRRRTTITAPQYSAGMHVIDIDPWWDDFRRCDPSVRHTWANQWLKSTAVNLERMWPRVYELLSVVRANETWRDAGDASFEAYVQRLLRQPFAVFQRLEETHHFAEILAGREEKDR